MNEISNIFNNQKLDVKKLEKIEALPEPQYRYIIAITPRSGSSYLSDVMTNTENLGRPAEILNQSVISNILKTISGRNPDEYLRNAMRLRKTRNSVAGLKASWFQFRNFVDCVTDKNYLLDFKYIYLIRRDLNAQAVSLYRATASNVFHTNIAHSEEAINKLNALEYNFDEIKKWHKHIVDQELGWQNFFYENSIVPLCLFYEDIEADILWVLKRIATYIGVNADTISLPEKTSVFEKVSDSRNIEWTHRFALDFALQNQQVSITVEKSIFDIDYNKEINSKVKLLFTYHGFKTINEPKVPVISTLPCQTITIKDAFITAARFNVDKTLLGAIYENKKLINKATYRGVALYKQHNPLTLSDDSIKNAQVIKGKCVYLGWLSTHSNHLLFETLSRFWVLDNIDVQNSIFIFHPIGNTRLVDIVNNELAQAIFNCFGIKTEQLVLANTNISIDELVIPTPLSLLQLTADFRQQFIYKKLKDYLLASVPLTPAKPINKLYVSSIKQKTTAIIVETVLQQQGFEHIVLEQFTFSKLIKLISEASIIAGDGHLTAYLSLFACNSAKIICFDATIVAAQLISSTLVNIETDFVSTHLLTNGTELEKFFSDYMLRPERIINDSNLIVPTLIKSAKEEQQWREYFLKLATNPQMPQPIQTTAKVVIPQELRDILRAVQQNDMVLVETKLRQLNENLSDTPEANRAKRWLAARAIVSNNIELAQEIYHPFTMNISLKQALVLPNVTEADLNRVLHQYPDWLELIITLAYFYWSRSAYFEASQILIKIVNTPTNDIIYHTATELYCDSLIRLKDKNSLTIVEKICQKQIHTTQTYRYPFFYLGAVIFKRCTTRTADNNLKQAISLFNEAKQRPEGFAYVSQGCFSVLDPDIVPVLAKQQATQFSQEIIFDKNNFYPKQQCAVLFFACDGIYLREYAFLLVASIARFNEYTVCHVHIVNPNEESAEIILKLRRQFSHIQLNVSLEFFNSKHKKPYYASVRFIRAEQLLLLYKSPLLVVDIDLIIEMSITNIMEFVGNKDVGFLTHKRSAILPWVEIQAGVVYLNDTANTHTFLQLLAPVLLSQLLDDSKESLWFIDQNALFSVSYFMSDTLSISNLLESKQKIYQSTQKMSKREFTKMKLAEFGFIDD